MTARLDVEAAGSCAHSRVQRLAIPGSRAGLVVGERWFCDGCGLEFYVGQPAGPAPAAPGWKKFLGCGPSTFTDIRSNTRDRIAYWLRDMGIAACFEIADEWHRTLLAAWHARETDTPAGDDGSADRKAAGSTTSDVASSPSPAGTLVTEVPATSQISPLWQAIIAYECADSNDEEAHAATIFRVNRKIAALAEREYQRGRQDADLEYRLRQDRSP